MKSTGERVLALAEGWIGTPYRHQASLQGVGCDCLGLVRGIWRALYGEEPELPPPYAPDWAERGGEDRLMGAAERYFSAVPDMGEARPGDLLLFRWRADAAAKHLGIFAGPQHFIHAYEQASVLRSALVPGWKRRIAGVFRFPDP
ncbi:NlpC/P60 family protein [Agrobacterium deltaense]|jgi:NlpC/P60 family putative phage cell wall peptidase